MLWGVGPSPSWTTQYTTWNQLINNENNCNSNDKNQQTISRIVHRCLTPRQHRQVIFSAGLPGTETGSDSWEICLVFTGTPMQWGDEKQCSQSSKLNNYRYWLETRACDTTLLSTIMPITLAPLSSQSQIPHSQQPARHFTHLHVAIYFAKRMWTISDYFFALCFQDLNKNIGSFASCCQVRIFPLKRLKTVNTTRCTHSSYALAKRKSTSPLATRGT